MGEIAERITEVKARIQRACTRTGRDPLQVCLVAVTKGVGVEAIREAYSLGLRIFGENYLQEAQPKAKELPMDIVWHFIGHLQRRKAKDVVGAFEVIHSLDSLRLAEEVAKRALEQGRTQKVFLQVNIGEEEAKSGLRKDEALPVLEALAGMKGIDLQGLMCIPPLSEDPEASRPYFRELKEMRDMAAGMIRRSPESLGLSMGMTGDFEVAIEEGATHIRVGTAIFGPRQ